jgi:hypothetical protein
MANPENKLVIDIVEGTNKKDSTKKWKALKIEIGEWSKLIFVGSDRPLIQSNFELEYIEKVINENK